jgi:hypothetical protein
MFMPREQVAPLASFGVQFPSEQNEAESQWTASHQSPLVQAVLQPDSRRPLHV